MPGSWVTARRSRIVELGASAARFASSILGARDRSDKTVSAFITALNAILAPSARVHSSWESKYHVHTIEMRSNGAMPSRSDLADFLRARRAALHPEDVGLIPGPRRRTQGLRREEVALLANVSVSWYTWLEQGRPINASIDVLHALADALRFDPVERNHLLTLSGHATRTIVEAGRNRAPESVVRLLDELMPAPAYVLGPNWDFLAWNRAFTALYPRVESMEVADRNLVWVIFGDPQARDLIGDWEAEARRVLSQFRAETVPLRHDRVVAALVARLHEASAEFAEWWPRHDVGGFESHRREFHHPVAGHLQFETQQLIPSGDPDLRIVVHLPVTDDNSASRLSDATQAPK